MILNSLSVHLAGALITTELIIFTFYYPNLFIGVFLAFALLFYTAMLLKDCSETRQVFFWGFSLATLVELTVLGGIFLIFTNQEGDLVGGDKKFTVTSMKSLFGIYLAKIVVSVLLGLSLNNHVRNSYLPED